jgi:MSHA pilin protein MshD
MHRPAGHFRRGGAFTLVEALLAVVVLAMAITAITMPFTAAAQHDQEDGRRTLAVALAQELMEEILARPFYDPQTPEDMTPGAEIGESGRDEFDNVDDYHGYAEAAGAIVTAGGDRLSDPLASTLSREVLAEYVWVSGQQQDAEATFIRVTVTVFHGDDPLVTLTRLVYAGGGA